eukprot:448744_1
MPPPKAIVCHLCNGKYFKRSYPIHLKQCEAKWKKTHTRCEYCGSAVSNHDWSDHRSHCKPTKRRKISKHSRDMPLQVPKSVNQQIIPTIANNAEVTKCEECEAENAVWKCLQCEQTLCTMCEVDLHRKGARMRHTRIPMNADALKQANVTKLADLSECKDNELTVPQANPAEDPRAQCKFCSRRFNPERVEKHMRICAKTQKRKLRVYDGAKKRIEDTEFEQYQYNRSKTPEKIKEWKEHGRRWRNESSQLRQIASVCSDLQVTKDGGSDKKDEESDIVTKAPSPKPVWKKPAKIPVRQIKRTAPKSRMNRNVALKGSSMRMKQRPSSNSSSYSSHESARKVRNNARRNNVIKGKETIKNVSTKPRVSRRRSTGKKPAIPKFERKKSDASQGHSKRATKRGVVKSNVNVNKKEVTAKENNVQRQPAKVIKRVRSAAKSLPRGIDLGVNVNKIFKDTPTTMGDYMERERLRRERRGKASSGIKQSFNKKSNAKPKPRAKPSVVERAQATKKMTRVQMKKEIRIDNQPIGGRKASKPSNAKDLASQRAAYFESLLRNQE